MRICSLLLTSVLFSLSVMAGPLPPSDGFLVKIKKGQKSLFLNAKEKMGYRIKRRLQLSDRDIFVVDSMEKSKGVALKKLQSLSFVEVAEPNYYFSIEPVTVNSLAAPTDPMFSQLWGLYNATNRADLNMLEAWDITKGDRRIKIAVIDTGIDYNHPDLAENIWVNEAELNGQAGVDDDGNGFIDDIHGYDFANRDGDPMDDNKHGTHCAGTIGAVHDNGIGVAGVMAHVSLMPVKFLDGSGSGTFDHAIEAIDYAIKMKADIMSNSWGSGSYSQLVEEAVKRAYEAGIVFVAAAGNSGSNNDQTPHYPSSYKFDNVISVAAFAKEDQLASFSCFGKKSVHVAAPGKDIVSTIPGNGYSSLSGTSMATPHISGVIGLLLSKEDRPDFVKLRERLMYSSTPSDAYRSKVAALGRVNAAGFLTNTITITPPVEPTNWIQWNLTSAIETVHPYLNNEKFSKQITVPGAKYLRVFIQKYDLESGYDFIKIKNKNGVEVDRISGIGNNFYSEYLEGDTLTIEFTSDISVQRWGFVIPYLEYVPQ